MSNTHLCIDYLLGVWIEFKKKKKPPPISSTNDNKVQLSSPSLNMLTFTIEMLYNYEFMDNSLLNLFQ